MTGSSSSNESLKQYSFAEVGKLNSDTRTVFVVHDKVYDVTPFLNEHPGGEEILLDHAGKDASEDFNDVGHSTDALNLMKKYLIGEIAPAERRNLPPKEGWKAGYNSKTPENEKYVSGPGLPFFLFASAVVVGLFAIYFIAFK